MCKKNNLPSVPWNGRKRRLILAPEAAVIKSGSDGLGTPILYTDKTKSQPVTNYFEIELVVPLYQREALEVSK